MDFTQIVSLTQNMTPIQIILTICLIILITNIPSISKWIISHLEKKKSQKDENHHANCPYRGDKHFVESLMPYINKAIDRAIKIFDLSEYKIIQEQMNYVDKVIINIKSVLMRGFKTLTESDREIRAYDKILDYTLERSKVTLHEWIKRNHILDKSEDEFFQYVKDTKATIIEEHINFLDKEYHSEDFSISRSDLLQFNKGMTIPKIEDIIDDLLHVIRRIGKERSDEIKLLEEQFLLF